MVAIGIMLASHLGWMSTTVPFSSTLSNRKDGESLQWFLQSPSAGNTLLQSNGRPRIKPDEFYFKGASEEEVEAFFYYDERLLQNESLIGPLLMDQQEGEPRPRRWWYCDEGEHDDKDDILVRDTKIVYIHMFRSAGTIIRALMRGYAEFCHAGLAIVTHCVDVGYEFLLLGGKHGDEAWYNSLESSMPYHMCQNSYMANRTGYKRQGGPMDSSQLQQVDIVAGRIPIGMGQFWKTKNDNKRVTAPPRHLGNQPTQSSPVQYVVWFRHPVNKFVSDILSEKRTFDWTVARAVEEVEARVHADLAKSVYYERYAAYLITPEQKYWVTREGISWSSARRVNLTRANLVRHNVVVGLVERIPESIELLRFMMDQSQQVTKLFEFFANIEMTSRLPLIQSMRSNITGDVVYALERNASLWSLVSDYTQYDQQIYETAVTIHERQSDWLHSLASWKH
jgi:hypothetical protein